VASAVSGIPELVREGETGYLVPPGDPWSLADRLQDLGASPSRRAAFGAAGRAVVERDFDLATGARRLHAAIRGCGEGRAPTQDD
jgi:colanic acid/amylovoran biosynthesis glycosyltransferase